MTDRYIRATFTILAASQREERRAMLAEIAESPKYRAFAEAKVKNLPQKCEECPYMAFCNGDCPRNNRTLCEGWKMFFDHSLKRFQELAAEAMLNL